MKIAKPIKALSAISAFTLAATATAVPLKDLSSNIELYGVFDIGMTYVDNEGGKEKFTGRDSVNWGNRLGVKGKIDLAPGYKGIFQLEHGLKLSDGHTSQYGSTWGRQAFAGIESEKYGTLTYGRQYDFMYDTMLFLNVSGYASTYAGNQGDLSRISGWRVNNSIKYKSPQFGGFSFGVMHASDDKAYAAQGEDFGFGEKPHETLSATFSYYAGGWSLSGVYVDVKGETIYPYAQMGVSGFLGEGPWRDGIIVDQEVLALGGFYQLGKFTLVGTATQTNLESHVNGEKATQNLYEVGFIYPLSAKTSLIVGSQYSELEEYTFNSYTAGLKYDFNQAAWLYASYSYMEGSEGTNINQGSGWYMDNSDTNVQQTARLGVILTF